MRVKSFLVLFGFLALTPAAHSFSSKELGFVHDTHAQLTERALGSISPFDFPDLTQFYQFVIIAGAKSEGILTLRGAHKKEDNSLTWWYGNESRWENDLIQKYQAYKITDAYTELGYYVHLVQDFQVPAHQTVTFHGPGSYLGYYALSPTAAAPNNTREAGPPSPTFYYVADQFESFVASNYASGRLSDSSNPNVTFNQSTCRDQGTAT